MGDWILAPANDLTSKQLRDAVSSLDEDMKGGPQKQISAAIMEMIGATDRPPQLDEEKAAARTLALIQMAWDYPIDVIVNACRNWRKVPSYGRWWPTEQDLRAQCEPLIKGRKDLRGRTMALLVALEDEEAKADRANQPSYFAGDKHKAFRDEMRKRMTPAKYDAYFHVTQIKYQRDSEILTRSPGAADRLNEIGGDVLASLGMTLRFCQFAWLHERAYFEERPSDQDRAATAEELRALARKLAAAGAPKHRQALRRAPEQPVETPEP